MLLEQLVERNHKFFCNSSEHRLAVLDKWLKAGENFLKRDAVKLLPVVQTDEISPHCRDQVRSKLDELKTSLVSKNIKLTLSEAAIDYLVEQGYDSKLGARPLGRKIDELIRVPLSKKILFNSIKNANVTAVLEDSEIVFNTVQKLAAKVNEDGIIEVN